VIEDLVPKAIVIAILLLAAFPVHEFAHALVAFRLGDATAKLYGRLTLNPIAHFDPIGGLILAASVLLGGFAIGWAKPTPVNTLNLRGGRNGDALVAAAGPISNLILAIAAALPLRYLLDHPELALSVELLTQVLWYFVLFNILLMIFNLIPIPPLDGSGVLFALVSPRTAWKLRPILQQYGMLVILVVFLFPIGGQTIGGRIISPISDAIFSVLVGV
jgi:Zn-dependent protease